MGSIGEGQEFSSREAKLPCRFRDRGLVLLMAEDGWEPAGSVVIEIGFRFCIAVARSNPV